MLSFGGIPLQVPSIQVASWIESRIPIREAFTFFRPRWLADQLFDPRSLFNWIFSRPLKLNCYFNPWGASRFSYAVVLADAKMHAAITAQNENGEALPFVMDDGLGSSITTSLFMLPPIPLSKIITLPLTPSLPLYLLILVDRRYYWWESAAKIEVEEGVSQWEDVYADIADGLGIELTIDPIPIAYLLPSSGFTKNYQYLPLLLDCVASSVGQRIVRTLDGNFYARNALTANGLMIANANLYKKYAGGSISLGVIEA